MTTKNHSKETSIRFIDLFAGIGGFRVALERNGAKCVFSSEWDKNSQKTYFENFKEMPHGDITKIKEQDVPEHDILCAGFPCQAFSISGKRKGFEDTRGTLFWDVARIINEKLPKVVFLENVKNFEKHDSGKTLKTVLDTLDNIGYFNFYEVLKSSDFGVPQARERIYIICFRKDLGIHKFDFPKPINNEVILRDILEEKPKDAKIISNENVVFHQSNKVNYDKRKSLRIGTIKKGGQGERIYSIDSAGITLSAYGGGIASKTGAYLVNGVIRKLSSRECARVQGFPDSFIIPVSYGLAQKQFGDSVSVPVIELLYNQIVRSLNNG